MMILALQETPRACRHCHYFDGWTAQDTCAFCANSGCSRVRTQPELGCSCFEREPGADDE